MNEITEKLNIEYENGTVFKDKLNIMIEKLSQNDERKNQFYKRNVLEPLEEKLYYIKQMILVKEQSILALEIVCKNNKEIIKNIDRIKNVTIVALNTAVVVAKSLYNQKLILNKINTLENKAENIILSTGNFLEKKENMHYDVASSNNTIESLKEAFNNAFKTISEVDAQNRKSFPENEIQIIELEKEGEHYEKK